MCDSQGIESFTINISREEGTPLGIEFDTSDGYSIRLTKIDTGGAFAKWNKRLCMEQMQSGDHIVVVNGVRGSTPGMLQQMRQAKELDIELHRPATYSIEITKSRDGLGIDTRQAQNSRSLMISHMVGKGALKDWNDSNEDKQVRVYDRIVKVNGKPGSVDELTSKIMAVKDGGKLGLTFMAAAPKSTALPAQVQAKDASVDVHTGEDSDGKPIPADTDNGFGSRQ
jgi:hypothetical protein